VRAGIAAGGIRNSHLLAIAPAGTISLLAGNVSSGVEPIYALEAERNIRDNKGHIESVVVRDFAYDLWLRAGNKRSATPDVFEVSHQISARAQLEMQGCLQPFVDSAISKTINLGTKASVNDVADAFMFAWSLPLKGCTVFRQGARDEVVLKACGDARRCDDSEYV
jgi:ribonucleoside-diphosphate reductase alpha chain